MHHSRLHFGRNLEATQRYESDPWRIRQAVLLKLTVKNLRQVWFPGAHSNIGGGDEDQDLADITLAWMMAQVSPFLDFTPGYILDENEEMMDYYRSRGENPRPWSFGISP